MSDMAAQLMNMPSQNGEGVDERGSGYIWRIGDGFEVVEDAAGIRGSMLGWAGPFYGTENAGGRRGILVSDRGLASSEESSERMEESVGCT